MKYFFALSVLLATGCSSSTAPISPYSPGGAYYMAPGTFDGSWSLVVNGFTTDSNFCTAVITESDSLIAGTITNDSTKEVLTLTGHHWVPFQIADCPNGCNDLHGYIIGYVSNRGDTVSSTYPNYGDSTAAIDFGSGDFLNFWCNLKQFPEVQVYITGIRK
jgi:hypothetical protein